MICCRGMVTLLAFMAVVLGGAGAAAAGPVAPDGIELVEFKLRAPSRPKLGAIIKVEFTLKNTSASPLEFSKQYGAFVSANWLSASGARMSRDFGYSYMGWRLFPGQSITVDTERIIDRAGAWRFTPGYNIGGVFNRFDEQAREIEVASSLMPKAGAAQMSGPVTSKQPSAETSGSPEKAQLAAALAQAKQRSAQAAARLGSGQLNSIVMYKGERLPIQLFPPDNPWNLRVRDLPKHPLSDKFIDNIGTLNKVHLDFGSGNRFKIYDRILRPGEPYGFPYRVVRSGTPAFPVSFKYRKESDQAAYPIPLDTEIEGGGSGDAHVLVIHYDQMKLYELFKASVAGDGWKAGSGAVFSLTSNKLRKLGWTSADAAGLPIFPGLVRYEEVEYLGQIRHALRFTVSKTQRAFILPATHWASHRRDQALPPMGLRLRLRANYDIESFPKHVRIILQCLKDYGMLLADNGGDMFISGAKHPKWDDDSLQYIGRVKARDFEAVYTGETITKIPK